VLAEQDRLEDAVILCAAADEWRKSAGLPLAPAARLRQDDLVDQIRARLDAATFDDAWSRGAALSPDEAIEAAKVSVGTEGND
jgi:hypothetical protein